MWLNAEEQNRETDEEHGEYCFQERFQLASVKFNRDCRGDREGLRIGYCSINIWNGLELKLDWSRKNSSYFENNFPKFLLSGNSNTSHFKHFKVCDVLHWVHFSIMKNFPTLSVTRSVGFRQVIFEYNFYSIYF